MSRHKGDEECRTREMVDRSTPVRQWWGIAKATWSEASKDNLGPSNDRTSGSLRVLWMADFCRRRRSNAKPRTT